MSFLKGFAWSSSFFILALPPVLAQTLPRPDHVVVVVEENHSYSEIVGSASAPYINKVLLPASALMTQSFAITHPSEPNYLALFSGSTQGLTSDACPVDLGPTPNLARSLLAGGFTFVGYSEGLPSTGSTVCRDGAYARKHNPWVNWQENGGFPAALSKTFKDFPKDYTKLPTVCWVIPDKNNDMHDGTIEKADDWLRKNLDKYAAWCKDHNGLLIVTWDEDDHGEDNHIVTLFLGPMVRPGKYDEPIDHYGVLRTLLDLFGLTPFNNAVKAKNITDIFLQAPSTH